MKNRFQLFQIHLPGTYMELKTEYNEQQSVTLSLENLDEIRKKLPFLKDQE